MANTILDAQTQKAMKKTLLTGALFSLSQLLFAQSSVTYSNLKVYKPGYSYVDHYDTVTTIVPSAGGASQTWDYSNLLSQTRDTISYLNVANTPHASMFNTSTVSEYSTMDDQYNYYTITTDGIFVDNFYISGSFIQGEKIGKVSPPLKFAPLPFTFGSNWNYTRTDDSLQKGDGVMFDSTRTTVTFDNFSEVDAYGSLKTPVGLFSNTLRLRTRVVVTTLSEGKLKATGTWEELLSEETVDTTYFFFADGAPVLLISAEEKEEETDPTVYRANYTTVLVPTGLDEVFIPGKSLGAFPNPSKGECQLSGISEILSLTDMTGKEVNYRASKLAENLFQLQVEGNNTGLFTAQVVTAQGLKKALKLNVVE